MLTPRTVAIAVSTSLGATLALSACTPDRPPEPAGTVTIGLLVDEVAGAGADAVRGAELAVEVVNGAAEEVAMPLAAGAGLAGLGGAPLGLVVAESGGRPEAAEAAVGQLHDDDAAAVVTADRAGAVELAGAYADRVELPIVDGATTAGYLLDLGYDWYFRTGPTDRGLAEAVFAALPAPGRGGQRYRVTTLTPADGRGADTATLLRNQAGTAGFEATGTVTAGDGAPGLLAQAAPDVVVAVAPAAGDGPELFRAIADWRAVTAALVPAPDGGAPAVVGIGPGFDEPAVAPAPDGIAPAPDGMLYAGAWSAELAGRAPLAQAVAARYRARFDAPMTEPAARAFTATMVLAMAFDAAGSTGPVPARAALRQLSVPATQTIMPWNGIRFGDDGQNQLAEAVVEQAAVDQPDGAELVLVYPPELAVADLVWQPPGPEPAP